MKQCFKCGTVKPITEFYKHKQMGDGYLGKCKDCTKKDTKQRVDVLIENPEWHSKEKDRHRNKYHRIGYKEKHKPTPESKSLHMREYISKYPEKDKARCLIRNLRKKLGVQKGIELHHWNYGIGFEQDVILLSVEDHYFLHRHIKYDQSEMMYRTLDGVLLDTNLKHFRYFQSVKRKHLESF